MKHSHVSSSSFILLSLGTFFFLSFLFPDARAQQTNFGVNLSGGQEPVQIDADNMEMQDREGIAIFTGNVSVTQGDRILRASKMIVHYNRSRDKGKKNADSPEKGLGSTGIDRIEVFEKVYIKSGNQMATGDQGEFNGQTNVMTLTGSKVVLTDGTNVATGCKLIAQMNSGKAFLENCNSNTQKKRVSVIIGNEKN